MSRSRKPISSRWRRFRHRFTESLSAIGQWILAPIKLLFLPAKLLELFHRKGVDTSRRAEKREDARHRTKSRWRFLWLPFTWLLSVCWLPVRLVQTAFRRGRQKQLLYFLPLLGVVVLTAFVGYQLVVKSAVVQNRYFLGAKRAVQSGRMDLATIYFRRLIDRGELTDSQSLQWAFVLLQTGDEVRYQQIVDHLASTQAPGHPPAHSVQALSLATKLQLLEQDFKQEWRRDLAATPALISAPPPFSADPQILKDLAFHLEHADKTDNRVKIAQAVYYVHSGQVGEAIRYLTTVAEESPPLYLTIADLARDRGVDEEIDEALDKASREFENQLRKTPLDENSRLLLVETKVRLGRLDEAERLIREGLRLLATARMRRAAANLVVERLKQNPPKNEFRSLGLALTELKAAIASDPEYRLPYQKLTSLLLEFGDPKNRIPSGLPTRANREGLAVDDPDQPDLVLPLQQVLEAMLTSDVPDALDHCNVAYLLWIKGDRDNASWHLEQAWGMDTQFSERAHHLALEFVFQEQGNVEWGTRLATLSVEKSPQSAGARLTQGQILFFRGEVEPALAEIEIALKTSRSPAKVHDALVAILLKLGREEEARFHRRQADALRAKAMNVAW